MGKSMVKRWLTANQSNALIKLFHIIYAATGLLVAFLLMAYFYQRVTVVSTAGLQLKKVAVERRQSILTFIDEQRARVADLGKNTQLIESFTMLKGFFDPSKRLFPNEQSADYKKEESKFDQYLSEYKSNYVYRDIFFVEPNGTIFYTNKIDVEGDNNLFSHQLASGMISQSFDRVRTTFTTDVTEFGIGILSKEPALYILDPLFVEGKFVGAIVVWVDESLLYKIVQNYSQLGRTGDIFLARNIGDRVMFVAPSRLYQEIAFKKISPADKNATTPARKASIGQEGSGLAVDSFGIPVVAAWLYVPQLDLGLTVQMQKTEIWRPITTILFWLRILLALLLACLLVHLYLVRNSAFIRRSFAYIFSRKMLRLIFWAGFISSLCLSVFLSWHHYCSYKTVLDNTKDLAQTKIKTQAAIINQHVIEIQKIAQAIAKDLQSSRLKKEDISIRIGRDLKEVPNVGKITVAFAPFKYNPETRLYAIQATRDSAGSIVINPITDDYMIPGSESEPESGWYDKAIKDGAYWSDSFIDPTTKKRSVLYVEPFFLSADQKPDGVIAILYNLDKIIADVSAIEIGKTGYAVILSSKVQFLHHPLSQYVKEKVSILDITREQNNEELKDIAANMRKGKSGLGSYYDHFSKLRYWISFEPIPSTHWTIAASFSEDSLDLPVNDLHKQRIWILISFVIALLFLAMLLSHLEQLTFDHVRNFSIFVTILFSCAIVVFWAITYRTSYQPNSGVTVVRDQINTDKFLEFLNLESHQRNEKKPIAIPTGIIIHTLLFENSNKVSATGYVWQRIAKGAQIVEGVRFPDALESSSTEVLRKQNGDETMVGWNFKASFMQKTRYSWFPFDRIHIDILMASSDFENNVVLMPDFTNYKSLDIDPLPGLNNQIKIPGFELERSYFSFSRIPSYNEVGLEVLKNVTDTVQLHYNVILERKLTNPFIIYLLPLLVILFSIYAVFLITFSVRLKFNAFNSLGAYTGIFFSLVILHQTLRNQYQAGELLYVEYFFFFTYITILFLILHSLMLQVSHYVGFINSKLSPYLRLLFWPIQFALWFIVTMITFYVIR